MKDIFLYLAYAFFALGVLDTLSHVFTAKDRMRGVIGGFLGAAAAALVHIARYS
jgi:hypothetical protein